MNVGSLFSGIGGLDLGLEQAGMDISWQCEIDPAARSVLRHNWPDTRIYEDIRDIDGSAPTVDLVCGGFPCQPISQAAARSTRADGWMWPEFARVVGLLRPRFVIIENPEALRYANRGLSEVLGDLARMGFDAEWGVVRAADVGAPHRRARIWVVAYTDRDREPILSLDDETSVLQKPGEVISRWSYPPSLFLANGFPATVVARLLGNAVVPQVAECIGRFVVGLDGTSEET